MIQNVQYIFSNSIVLGICLILRNFELRKKLEKLRTNLPK